MPDDSGQHRKEVRVAMPGELGTWTAIKYDNRTSRRGTLDTLDTKQVDKLKYVEDKHDYWIEMQFDNSWDLLDIHQLSMSL